MHMNNQLFEEAKCSDILSRELVDTLLESMEYNVFSFINWSIDVLRIIKTRIERGDKITDEVSGVVYTKSSFKSWVKKSFSSYIYSEVYKESKKGEKVYFQLHPCEGGYNLVMAPDGKANTYKWISSLSERFSLVYMTTTHIVYIKNIKTGNYSPFISENGCYCKYDKESGKILEVK